MREYMAKDGRRWPGCGKRWALIGTLVAAMFPLGSGPANAVPLDAYEAFRGETETWPSLGTMFGGTLAGPLSAALENHLTDADTWMRRGFPAFALIELEKAVILAPAPAAVHLARGVLFLMLGNPEAAMEAARDAQATAPGSAQAWEILGVAAARLGRTAEAEEAFRRLVALEPDEAIGYERLGDLLFETGSAETALRHYDAALARTPASPALLLKSALLLNEVGEPGTAIERAEAALRQAPGRAFAYAVKGDALARLGRTDEAVAAYREAIRRSPNFAWFRVRLGRFLAETQRLDDAVAVFRELVARKPDHLGAHLALAQILGRSGAAAEAAYHGGVAATLAGDFEEAVSQYGQALTADPEMLPALLDMATIHIERGDLVAAEQTARRAAELAPDSPSVHGLLGRIALGAGDVQKAAEAFDTALAIDPEFLPALRLTAGLLATAGQCDVAIGYYEAAIASAPADADLHRALGDCRRRLGDDGGAEAAYRRAVSLSPANAEALNALAWLALERGAIRDGLPLARLAALIVPDDAAIVDTLAWAQHLDGRHDLAEANLQRVLRLLPEHPTVLYHLAAVYDAQGRRGDAVRLARQALDLDPAFPEAAGARSLLAGGGEGACDTSFARETIGPVTVTLEDGGAYRDWMPIVGEPGPDGGSPLVASARLTVHNSGDAAVDLAIGDAGVVTKAGAFPIAVSVLSDVPPLPRRVPPGEGVTMLVGTRSGPYLPVGTVLAMNIAVRIGDRQASLSLCGLRIGRTG